MAALFVEFAPQQKALLVADIQPNIAAETMSVSLSVALCELNQWTSRQRLPLETSTRKLNCSDFVSLGAMHKYKVLCVLCHSSVLEVVEVNSSGTGRRLQPIRLGFTHYCFAIGRSECTELLLIKVDNLAELLLFEVAESLRLRLLRVIEVGCDRLLWRAGLLFAVCKFPKFWKFCKIIKNFQNILQY